MNAPDDARHCSQSPFKGKTGLPRLINAMRYSLDGLCAAYRHENAFRQETWGAAGAIAIACFVSVAPTGRAILIGSVLLVLVVELVNSAIEAAIDRISLDRHPLAKRAKDIGSAAVLLSLVNAAVAWILVLAA